MKEIFSKIVEWEGKRFGLAEVGELRIAKTNVRQTSLEVRKKVRTTEDDLVESIKAIGLQQLPVSDLQGNIFIGGRRLKAFKMLGKTMIPVEIRDIGEEEQIIASWSENVTKREMTADEEGRIFKLLCEKLRISHRKLGRKLNESHTNISDKIRIYETYTMSGGRTIPYAKPSDSSKKLTFEKAVDLIQSWITDKERKKMISEIEGKGMTSKEVRRAVNLSKAMKSVAETFDNPKKKVLEKIKPHLFKKGMRVEQLIFEVNEVVGASHKVVPHKIPKEDYATLAEADDEYFIPRGGRCLGKKVEEYWVGTVNPVKEKRLKETKKEK